MNSEGSDGDIWAIVPVKRLSLAKSRLDPVLGEGRGRFMRTLARHTLKTLIAAPGITHVLVVTGDSEIAADAVAAGAQVVRDEGKGLNHALTQGIQHARRARASACIVVPADLPLLDAQCLGEIIADFSARGRIGLGAVRCKDGDGTTVTIFPARAPVRPCYGPGSFAAHMAMAGIETFEIFAGQAAFDVDTPADLERLGLITDHDPALTALFEDNRSGFEDNRSGFEDNRSGFEDNRSGIAS